MRLARRRRIGFVPGTRVSPRKCSLGLAFRRLGFVLSRVFLGSFRAIGRRLGFVPGTRLPVGLGSFQGWELRVLGSVSGSAQAAGLRFVPAATWAEYLGSFRELVCYRSWVRSGAELAAGLGSFRGAQAAGLGFVPSAIGAAGCQRTVCGGARAISPCNSESRFGGFDT